MKSTSALDLALAEGEALVTAGAPLPAALAAPLLSALRLAVGTIQDVRRLVGDGPRKAPPKPRAAPGGGISYKALLASLRRGKWILEPSSAPPGYYSRVTKMAQAYHLTEDQAEAIGRWLALDAFWGPKEITVDEVVKNLAKWLPKAENLMQPGSATVWEEAEDV